MKQIVSYKAPFSPMMELGLVFSAYKSSLEAHTMAKWTCDGAPWSPLANYLYPSWKSESRSTLEHYSARLRELIRPGSVIRGTPQNGGPPLEMRIGRREGEYEFARTLKRFVPGNEGLIEERGFQQKTEEDYIYDSRLKLYRNAGPSRSLPFDDCQDLGDFATLTLMPMSYAPRVIWGDKIVPAKGEFRVRY